MTQQTERVLVVDDEEVVCTGCKRILSLEGYHIDIAMTAERALEMVKQNSYSLIIVDLMMPEMSGLEFLKTVKKTKPEMNVIMITGYATTRTFVEAMKCGAFDYIPKPFTSDELSNVVARALERKKMYEEENRRSEKEAVKTGQSEEEIPAGEEASDKRMHRMSSTEFYYLWEHSWAKVEENGTVLIGMDDIFQKTAGSIINVDLPFDGDEVEQGGVCSRVTSEGMRVHHLWAPVGGRIVEVNQEVNRDGSLANREPYGRGWLIRIEPTNLEEDIANLIRGSASFDETNYSH